MEKIIIPTLLISFLVSFYYKKRFWVILFTVLKKCWFPIFTCLITILMFGFSSQGKNIINEIELSKSGFRSITTMLALWLWAYNCYKLSITALNLIDNKAAFGINEGLAKRIEFYVPIAIGYLPFIVSICVIFLVKVTPDYPILLYLALIFVYFILYLKLKSNPKGIIEPKNSKQKFIHIFSFYFFFLYDKVMRPFNVFVDRILKRELNKLERVEGEKFDYRKHWKSNMNGEQIINWAVIVCLYICIGIWPYFFAKVFGPIGLIFIALSFFVVLGTIFIYLKGRFGFPVFPVLIVLVLLFSLTGDNNESGVVNVKKQDNRPAMNKHFQSWVKSRSKNNDTINVILVAAEGGGMRSAFWTYSVLRNLAIIHPKFSEQLYAISGVSGGSLGAALYCTQRLKGLTIPLMETPIINEDNISPVIGGALFRELIQSILPFNIEALDRSKVLDETFEKNWEKVHIGKNYWRENVMNLWEQQRNTPALLLNTIHVETGNSVVLSNLKLDTTHIQSVDMLGKISSSLSLSQAVGLSARFPILMPAGKFVNEDGSTWGHLADGGYFENSGVATMYQVYLNLREELEKIAWEKKQPTIRFQLILLSNANAKKRLASSQGLFMHEFAIPLNTLLNSWNAKGYSYAHIARSSINKLNQNDQFYEFRLNHDKIDLPLGWFLSEKSRQEISRQAREIKSNAEYKSFVNSVYK